MIKNIMGAAIAVALAVGIGTTGVISNTTYKKPTQIIAAAKTTTLTDYHSNTEFTKSSDVKKIISTYGLKDSDKTSKIVYIPINNYSVNDADGQNNEVPVDTRLANYSVKKKGYKDQVSYVRSITANTSLAQSIKESVTTTYDFSNIVSVSGKNEIWPVPKDQIRHSDHRFSDSGSLPAAAGRKRDPPWRRYERRGRDSDHFFPGDRKSF